jgi:hypothetical protein
VLTALLLATPAAAAEWQIYKNVLVGYAIELPDGLGKRTETDAGVVIESPTMTLTVFGLEIAPMDFATAAETAAASTAGEGYSITGKVTTPERAHYAAVDGARRQAVGLVVLCPGSALAGYELRYMEADIGAMTPVIERLDATLRNIRNC